MSGFCLKVSRDGNVSGTPITVVDLCHGDQARRIDIGLATIAWSRFNDSRQWKVYRQPGRVLVLEGQVDRAPSANEALERWLPGRWGSFRGVEITAAAGQPTRVRAFVDPLASRPLFYLAAGSDCLISDKLSTLCVNGPARSVNWSAALELMLLGSYSSAPSTIENAVQLQPGELVEIVDGAAARVAQYRLPESTSITPEYVRRDPAGSLLAALQEAVKDTWDHADSHLMLSGGLDSRAILALAGGRRKAFTMNRFDDETVVARQVAAACEADLQEFGEFFDDYASLLPVSHLVSGAMHELRCLIDLDRVREWRAAGIRHVVHGYLFDTLLKGFFVHRWPRYTDRSSVLFRFLGDRAVHFLNGHVRRWPEASECALALLSPEGVDLLARQMRGLAASLEPCRVGNLDFTFERHILGNISRQLHYGGMLCWLEAQDVSSPVFHPALWSWYAASKPEDRMDGRAMKLAILSMKHPIREIPDANTGKPVALEGRDWQFEFRNHPLYPLARPAWRLLLFLRGRSRPTPSAALRGFAGKFRNKQALQSIGKGVGELIGNPLFDKAALEGYIQRFEKGQDELVEPLVTATALGHWSALARRGNKSADGQTGIVRSFETGEGRLA